MSKLLYPPLIRKIVTDTRKHMLLSEIAQKYGISRHTVTNARRIAVKQGILGFNEKEYARLVKDFYTRSFEGAVKKRGEAEVRRNRSERAYKTSKGDPLYFAKLGSLGGLATHSKQKTANHVLKNLMRGFNVSSQSLYYKNTKYQSKKERLLGALFLEYHLLDKIVKRINYHVLVGEKEIDFLVKGKALEFHDCDFIDRKNGVKDYKKDRPRDLKKRGFKRDIIIVSNEKEIYPNLKSLGIKDNYIDFCKKKKKLLQKFKEEDKYRDEKHEKRKLEERIKGEIPKKMDQKYGLEMLNLMR